MAARYPPPSCGQRRGAGAGALLAGEVLEANVGRVADHHVEQFPRTLGEEVPNLNVRDATCFVDALRAISPAHLMRHPHIQR